MIWSLKLYDSDTLCAGDSKGDLSLWDVNHGTLLKTFSNLKADITAIEVNRAAGSVYATGVDSRIMTV